jgi:hypothetical protein
MKYLPGGYTTKTWRLRYFRSCGPNFQTHPQVPRQYETHLETAEMTPVLGEPWEISFTDKLTAKPPLSWFFADAYIPQLVSNLQRISIPR